VRNVIILFSAFFLAPSLARAEQLPMLRVGYFPNITHAHALVAQNMAHEGKDWFAPYLGGTEIKWHSFNAGPSAMEAIFANAIDITYVGPSPVLNAWIRSKGGVTVVSGSMRGGGALVVPKDSTLSEPRDFIGKRIATPQLGNTQDVNCRAWLGDAGIKTAVSSGGEVKIMPMSNPSIMPAFLSGNIDAAWTVEPWVSRLENEAGGRILYSEPPEKSLTTVLAASRKFEDRFPQTVAGFIKGHRALGEWIRANPEETKQRIANELTRQMKGEFPRSLVDQAWPRLTPDDSIAVADFEYFLEAALGAGLIKGEKQNITDLVKTHD